MINYVLFSKAFYSLGDEVTRARELRLITLLIFFIYWIFIQNLLIPISLHFITPIISKYATIEGVRLFLITTAQWSYVVLAFIGLGMLHSRLPRDVQHSILLRHKRPSRILNDIGFALLILIIALPTVTFLDGLFEYILAKLVQEPLPNQVAIQYLIESKGQNFAYLTMILVAIFFAPLIEEYLFRGLMQTFIRGYFGPKGSILITSSLFSIFHFSITQGIGNIPLLVSLFIFALYLGFCYEKRQSLVTPIVLHMAFNATSVIRMHFFEG